MTRRDEMRRLVSARAAGWYMDYGVPDTHSEWIFLRLMRARESVGDVVGPKDDDASMDLDWVRVRDFETELACLPTTAVDDILAGRKVMRKVKQRIETCVKILSGMH